MKDWKTPVFFVLAVLLMCLASYIAGGVKGRRTGREKGYRAGYEAGWNAPRPADTLVVRDTLLIDRPVEYWREVVRTEYVAVTDTIRERDTLWAEVPVERRTYKGDDYEAQVSGWHPSLDWVRVYPKTIYIKPEVPAPRRQHWGLGITAGPGAVYWGGQVHAGVGLAAGLTYRF